MTAQATESNIINVESRDHFHELRSKGLGSSDMPAVIGVSKYKTPYELWREKTGRVDSFEGNDLTEGGIIIEPIVADYFEKRSGHRVIKKTESNYMVVHDTHDFIRVQPDREFFHKDGGRGALECKSKFFEFPEKGSLPLDWFVQNQYQIGTCNLKIGAIAWVYFSFGPKADFEEFDLNVSFYDYLVNEAGNFWNNHVLKDIPPPLANSEDVIKAFPKHMQGKSLKATPDLFSQFNEVVRIKSKIRELTADLEHLSEPIKIAMEDCESVVYDGDTILTWKKSKDSEMIDAKMVKEKYPEIYQECLKIRKGSRRFLIKGF